MNNDSELMEKISQGHEESFTTLFDCYYPSLCFYTNKYIHDLDESRSLIQEIFIDIWIKRNSLQINQSLKAYLFKSAHNKARDYLKHKAIELKYENEHPFAEAVSDPDLIEEAELNARINSAINELPEKCREIFILCRFEELRYSEIASRLEISVKTVEMQMGIALKKLRTKLSPNQHIQILLHLFFKNNRPCLQGN